MDNEDCKDCLQQLCAWATENGIHLTSELGIQPPACTREEMKGAIRGHFGVEEAQTRILVIRHHRSVFSAPQQVQEWIKQGILVHVHMPCAIACVIQDFLSSDSDDPEGLDSFVIWYLEEKEDGNVI